MNLIIARENRTTMRDKLMEGLLFLFNLKCPSECYNNKCRRSLKLNVVIYSFFHTMHVSSTILSFFHFFSVPDVLCDLTDLIWRKGAPLKAMNGRTAHLSDGLLVEVFLSCKANARRSQHSRWDYFIIILIISDRRDTRGKWPLARNPDRS